ncbi:hypothetical protein BXZ70DRAFT_1081220 [Cristinia sonorae]|uniref:Uncharacterized protein n=1 Tax=Cristinia sonorae TaxID=1940300 RepID=A0A8K0UCF8_9AGAR|nr:hypothetical protein BXZ70DRAFT_1081220 [Cristinia sonorae]
MFCCQMAISYRRISETKQLVPTLLFNRGPLSVGVLAEPILTLILLSAQGIAEPVAVAGGHNVLLISLSGSSGVDNVARGALTCPGRGMGVFLPDTHDLSAGRLSPICAGWLSVLRGETSRLTASSSNLLVQEVHYNTVYKFPPAQDVVVSTKEDIIQLQFSLISDYLLNNFIEIWFFMELNYQHLQKFSAQDWDLASAGSELQFLSETKKNCSCLKTGAATWLPSLGSLLNELWKLYGLISSINTRAFSLVTVLVTYQLLVLASFTLGQLVIMSVSPASESSEVESCFPWESFAILDFLSQMAAYSHARSLRWTLTPLLGIGQPRELDLCLSDHTQPFLEGVLKDWDQGWSAEGSGSGNSSGCWVEASLPSRS